MKTEPTYPDFFARFYDTIYQQVRNDADHAYYLEKIEAAMGPILEVGTGTGRFFMDAIQRGADIYGIDFSPAMIEVLKHKLSRKHHHRVKVQDIRTMNPDMKFKLIIAPFRVFMHLISIEDQLKALNRVYQFLDDGGSFIFDLFIPDLKLLQQGLDNMMDYNSEYEPGMKLKRYVSMKADPVHQISKISFRLEWQEGGTIQSKTWNTELRFFFKYELELLLRSSLFADFNIYGDFNENPIMESSKEYIIVCRK
ncbi:MAG: class I SAM-dependent methyltransferase [Bacteroidetes bacterium]|nr:class I SAM-dependent methyltransferase [Bacteroidota bacterium]